jgi:hypothetical protein
MVKAPVLSGARYRCGFGCSGLAYAIVSAHSGDMPYPYSHDM